MIIIVAIIVAMQTNRIHNRNHNHVDSDNQKSLAIVEFIVSAIIHNHGSHS